jgi:hypothetical protein
MYIKHLEEIPENYKPFKGHWWYLSNDNLITLFWCKIPLNNIDDELLK